MSQNNQMRTWSVTSEAFHWSLSVNLIADFIAMAYQSPHESRPQINHHDSSAIGVNLRKKKMKPKSWRNFEKKDALSVCRSQKPALHVTCSLGMNGPEWVMQQRSGVPIKPSQQCHTLSWRIAKVLVILRTRLSRHRPVGIRRKTQSNWHNQ